MIGAAVAPLAAGAACANTPDAPPAASATPGQTLAPVADVPVGKAKVVDGTLITQPSAGVFKAFVARCTHAGCALAVTNSGIECPCHGSKFNLEGAVTRGPATEPLKPATVHVQGTAIVSG